MVDKFIFGKNPNTISKIGLHHIVEGSIKLVYESKSLEDARQSLEFIARALYDADGVVGYREERIRNGKEIVYQVRGYPIRADKTIKMGSNLQKIIGLKTEEAKKEPN